MTSYTKTTDRHVDPARYQGPLDQSGRPMQQQFNPTGYVPHGFFGGGRAGLNRQQMNQAMQTYGQYGNALGGFKNQANTGYDPMPEQQAPEQKVQTGGGFPVSEAGTTGYTGSSVRGTAGGITGVAPGTDNRVLNKSFDPATGTYTDPNSYYTGDLEAGTTGYVDPMTDPNFDPAANMQLPQSGTVAELAAASQAQESALAQLEDIPSDTPATGLTGYEQAMGQGFDAGMEGYQGGKQEAIQMLLNAYRGSVNPVTGEQVMGSRDFDIQETNRAADAMRGYSEGGAEAQQLQAALTGALGPEAQAKAIANFQESPGQKYLREQTERGVLRNAASVGGLGGGNVLKALQANAAGLASQDFQNQFNRLSNVADRGMTASGTMADLFSNLGSRQAQMRNQMGTNIAGVAERYGQRAGDLGFNTGTLLGANRQRVGDRIADNIAATSGAVAGQQSGDLLATLLGGDASSLVNLITAAQSGDAASNEALAALLANLTVGEGSNLTGALRLQPITNTAAEGLEAFGSLMSGGGTAAQAAGAPV